MLSDTLHESVHTLRDRLDWYTKGTFAKTYEPELIQRVKHHIDALDAIRAELDTAPNVEPVASK